MDEAHTTLLYSMFRNDFVSISRNPWFREVAGGWINAQFDPTCAVPADLTRNGADDLILCNPRGKVQFFQQTLSGTFRNMVLPNNGNLYNWMNARVVDVTNDGLADLVVSKQVLARGRVWNRILIFRGIQAYPYFNFGTPHFTTNVPAEAYDVEVLDVNGDGRKDIYIPQRNAASQTYCGTRTNEKVIQWWGGGESQPPTNWIPPKDQVRDILLFGRNKLGNRFRKVTMWHEIPGCSTYMHKFSDKAMILSKSDTTHPGFNAFLEW